MHEHDSYWLWVGALVGALAVAFTSATALAEHPHWTSTLMIFTYVMFAAAAACLFCAVRGIRFPGVLSHRAEPLPMGFKSFLPDERVREVIASAIAKAEVRSLMKDGRALKDQIQQSGEGPNPLPTELPPKINKP